MPLIENPLSKLLEHVLQFHNERHDVVASNIANASTPGYRAFDLVLQQRLGAGKPLEMVGTHARHLTGHKSGSGAAGRIEVSHDAARLDGNNVSLDKEFLKLTENRVMYQAFFELMDKWGGLNQRARDLR